MSRALRALAWIAPRAAMARARALAALDARRAYDGARLGRRGAGFSAGAGSANVEIGAALARLRNRSRDLARNGWAGPRILDVSVGHAIGTGIAAVPATGVDRLDRQLGEAYAEWCDQSDVEGVLNFGGQQALAVRSMLEGGDSLVRRIHVQPTRKRRVGLALQTLEGDHLDEGRDGGLHDGVFSRLGVGLGEWNRRLGYWLHADHPGEGLMRSARLQSGFVAADDVAHLYRPLRPGQLRGVPIFAPIMMTSHDLADLMDAITVKARTEACFGAFVYLEEGQGPAGANLITGEGANADRIEEMRPGMVNYLKPGERVAFAQPSGTGQYEPIMLSSLYGMAAGAGVTFDQLTGDMRRANYSSMKAGRIEQRRLTEQLQWLTVVPQLMRPVSGWFVEASILSGVLVETYRGRPAPWRFEYVMPANEPLDPRKDLEADILAVRAGRMSPQEFISGWGRDYRKVIAEYEDFLKQIDKKGLVFDIDPRRTSRVGVAQSPPDDPAGDRLPDEV